MAEDDPPRGVVLIHGGLYEPIGPEEFWHRPGIVEGLEAAGLRVIAPARLATPDSWAEEVEHLLPSIALADRGRKSRWAVVGGSNGCSLAIRIAIDHRDIFDRIVLCWPATANDPLVDQESPAPKEMILGETLRGVTDSELATIALPVEIIPSNPSNRYHRAETVSRLGSLIPGARIAPGFPESPHPAFREHREAFVASLVALLT